MVQKGVSTILTLGILFLSQSAMALSNTPDQSWSAGHTRAMAVTSTTIYIGGGFVTAEGKSRYYLAALDAETGELKDWNPNANSDVRALAISGSTLYVGGDFTRIAGQTRNCLAAFNMDTGELLPWNPGVGPNAPYEAFVASMAVSGSTLYVGGWFDTIGGQPRGHIAAFNTNTGHLTPWNPGINTHVWAMEVSGSTLYVGGNFEGCAGQKRWGLAAFDMSTGELTPWNPETWDPLIGGGGQVYSLACAGSTVYVGGHFGKIGGQVRTNIAALDATVNTNNATAWNPVSIDASTIHYGQVMGLAVYGSTVFAAGEFTRIGGQDRNGLAALYRDSDTDNAKDWVPCEGTGGRLRGTCLLISGQSLYVGSCQDIVAQKYGPARFNLGECTLSLDVNPPEAGSIVSDPVPSLGLDGYEQDTVVTLAAQVSPGYLFTGWSGDLTGTANPATIVMDGDKAVTANFAKPREIRLEGDLTFDNVAVNGVAQQIFSIHNDGILPLTVASIDYPEGFSGAWSGQIPPGGSQSVTVTFAPIEARAYGGTITINADHTSGTNTIAASGTGVSRVVRLEGNMSFGNVVVGNYSERALTIHNDGTGPLTISSISYPDGFSGAWSGAIPAGGSQTVTVRFAPSEARAYSGTITVNANHTSGTNTLAVSGTGLAATRVMRLEGDLAFGELLVNTTSQRTFTIHNDGNSPLSVTNILYPAGFSGAWSGQIAAGESQAVTVTFAPTAGQAYGGSVIVNSNKTSGNETIAASGTGLARVVRLVGDMAFGVVPANSAAQRTLTIHNDGNSPLAVTSIAYPNGFSGAWNGQIAGGASRAVTVTFAPTALQAYGGTITVNCNSTSGTKTISATGSTITRIIRLTGSLDCRSVLLGTSVRRTLVIRNDGDSPLTVNSISCPDGYSGEWSGTVAPGGLQAVTITFTPTQVRLYEGTISVDSNATSGTNTILITGRGTNEITRTIRLEGDLAYGHCAAHVAATRTLTIHNDGSVMMTVNSISCPTGFYGAWNGEIESGESHAVTVEFVPEENRAYSGTIVVNSDANGGTPTIAVSGTSVPETRVIRLTGDMAFGDVAVGATEQRTLTIHNDGDGPLTVNAISYPSAFSGAWSGEIAAGGSQAVTVSFSPSAEQAYTGTITVNCDSTGGTNTVSASGTGVGAEVAATIGDVWWSDEVDLDRDGYNSSMKLWWKPDVADGQSLTVYEKVYWRVSGDDTWTTCGETDAHTITGDSASNAAGCVLAAKSHGLYDYRIEVYTNEKSTLNCLVDSGAADELHAYQEELTHEDIVSQSMACAGAVKAVIVETALPLDLESDPDAIVAQDAALSIRYVTDAPVDADSAWAAAECNGEELAVHAEWVSIDDADGWIVVTPEDAWPVSVVTVTVGACDPDGVEFEPVVKMFRVADAAKADEPSVQNGQAIVQADTYTITPEGAFAEPLTVELPLPNGVAPDDVEIYYYSESAAHAGWYPADQIKGWLVPSSRQTITRDGHTYIQFQVNHSGTVQLGHAETVTFAGLRNAMPDLMILTLMLVLLLAPKRRYQEPAQ